MKSVLLTVAGSSNLSGDEVGNLFGGVVILEVGDFPCFAGVRIEELGVPNGVCNHKDALQLAQAPGG